MTTTSPVIILNMGEAVLSSVASPDVHSRTDIDDLVTGDAVRGLKYATYEPDKWLLDGSFHFAPDPGHLGFVSDTISLVDKSFTSDPVLTLTLDAVVDIEQGVTLEFSDVSGDYATAVNIEYQDAGTTPIDDDDYVPTGYNFFAEAPTPPIADVKFIVITFSETSEAYRHIKLLGVYVDGVLFDKNDIQKANIIEEISPLSVELPNNELNFTLFSEDGDFSIVDPQGIYTSLKENQIIDVYEFVDDIRIYMGRFYLKDWDTKTDTLMDMEAVCAIGILEDVEYTGVITIGGGITSADAIIPVILTDTNIGYDIEAVTGAKFIQGWIPIVSARVGIRNTCFSVSGYVDCSRSKTLNVLPLLLAGNIVAYDYEFTNADIINPDIKLFPFITDVIVNAYEQTFSATATNQAILDTTLAIGDHTFFTDGPVGSTLDVGLTTATVSVITGIFNGFIVSVTAPGRVVINKTSDMFNTANEFVEHDPAIPATLQPKKIVAKDVFILHPDYAQDVLDNAYDYYKERYIQTAKVIASDVSVGDSVSMPTTKAGFNIGGIVERQEIDLAGGFVSKITVKGIIFEP